MKIEKHYITDRQTDMPLARDIHQYNVSPLVYFDELKNDNSE